MVAKVLKTQLAPSAAGVKSSGKDISIFASMLPFFALCPMSTLSKNPYPEPPYFSFPMSLSPSFLSFEVFFLFVFLFVALA
tara:strand:- start:319 stop:561 length:243 start_codon:yes stop_codon:yes gene_type:complete